METTQENELIWTDEKRLKSEKLVLVKIEAKLNGFIDEAEKVLNRKLTSEEKESLRSQGFKYLDGEVKKLYQFPSATEGFNLKSLGIDLTAAKNYKPRQWQAYEWSLGSDGKFRAKEEQPAFDRFSYYADTDQKREAIRIGRALVELAGDAESSGLLDGMRLGEASKAFMFVVIPCGDIGRAGASLEVNYKGIATTEIKKPRG